MAEHEPCVGASDDWYTPREIFTALGLTFDLDPCSPGADHWVPARLVFTIADDGLLHPWTGLVFMNPPFGGRNGHVPWLARFLNHGNGIAIVRAYTSSGWWHEWVATRAETVLFPKGKTKFVRPDGSVGGSPGHGVVLIGMGDVANAALARSGLGWFVDLRSPSASRDPAPRPDHLLLPSQGDVEPTPARDARLADLQQLGDLGHGELATLDRGDGGSTDVRVDELRRCHEA